MKRNTCIFSSIMLTPIEPLSDDYLLITAVVLL